MIISYPQLQIAKRWHKCKARQLITGCDPACDDEVHRLPFPPWLPRGGGHIQVILHWTKTIRRQRLSSHFQQMIMTNKKQAFGKCSRGKGAADEDRPGRKCWLWNPGESPQSMTSPSPSLFLLKVEVPFLGVLPQSITWHHHHQFFLCYYRTCTLPRCFWKLSSGSFPIPFSLIRFLLFVCFIAF